MIDYLNVVFGEGDRSRKYWMSSMKRRLHQSFTFGLSAVESEPAYDLQVYS